MVKTTTNQNDDSPNCASDPHVFFYLKRIKRCGNDFVTGIFSCIVWPQVYISAQATFKWAICVQCEWRTCGSTVLPSNAATVNCEHVTSDTNGRYCIFVCLSLYFRQTWDTSVSGSG